MSEIYTSGLWQVKPGEEDDFVAAWKDFVAWGSEQPGSGTFRLARNVDDPGRFMSFAPWVSFEAQRAWRETDEFDARLGRVKDHVETFESSTYELVTEVAG
jgi:heme-degrading monooxygenase HmoA